MATFKLRLFMPQPGLQMYILHQIQLGSYFCCVYLGYRWLLIVQLFTASICLYLLVLFTEIFEPFVILFKSPTLFHLWANPAFCESLFCFATFIIKLKYLFLFNQSFVIHFQAWVTYFHYMGGQLTSTFSVPVWRHTIIIFEVQE